MKVAFQGGDPNRRITIEAKLLEELKNVKQMVTKRQWDYVCCVAGIPGTGKSTLASWTIAPYLCPWFDLSYVCFEADEFIRKTNSCPEYSAVVLDESFADLNSRTTMTKAFQKIINHLQIIRQKHLFIILCLPNFFDLSKSIAIFRLSHLFVCTTNKDTGKRGSFLAFGRQRKRELYIKGGKYVNYNAVRANFPGEYRKNRDLFDYKAYEVMKLEHLYRQAEILDKGEVRLDRAAFLLENAILNLTKLDQKYWTQQKLADIFEIGLDSIKQHWKNLKEDKRVPPELLKKSDWRAKHALDRLKRLGKVGEGAGIDMNNPQVELSRKNKDESSAKLPLEGLKGANRYQTQHAIDIYTEKEVPEDEN